MSFLSFLIPAMPPIAPALPTTQVATKSNGRTDALYQLSLRHHLLLQSIKGAYVSKVPMFYAGYSGPKRTNLDVVGANARAILGKEFVLVGKVLGPVDATETAIYSFLINRGGASSPGPIEGRPEISYDAVVNVTTGMGGITGAVILLDAHGQAKSTTMLATSAIHVMDTSVTVTVPASLLPSSGSLASRARGHLITFAFAAGVPGGTSHDIAGLAPEFVSIPI
jgi:hypothetical protein